jgi:hypothetical protein
MKENSYRCSDGKISRDPWDVTGERIPETFPTRMAFFKTVCLGIGITLIEFGLLSILIIKPWH